jgi:hypothetical protein
MGTLGQTAGHARFIVKYNGYGSVKIHPSARKYFTNQAWARLYLENPE